MAPYWNKQSYCWQKKSCTSWYGSLSHLFTRSHTCWLVQDFFFHQQYFRMFLHPVAVTARKPSLSTATGTIPTYTHPKTNSSHLPGWRNPKGDSSSNPMCFRCELLIFREGTPQKINMDPKNHPIEKENPLPNLHLGFHVSFQGGYMYSWKTSPGSATNCRTWSPHKRWCWYHHPVYVAKPS